MCGVYFVQRRAWMGGGGGVYSVDSTERLGG